MEHPPDQGPGDTPQPVAAPAPLPWQQADPPPLPSPPVPHLVAQPPPAADPWAPTAETAYEVPFPPGPAPAPEPLPVRAGRRTWLTVAAATVAVLVLAAGAVTAWRAATGNRAAAGAPTPSSTPLHATGELGERPADGLSGGSGSSPAGSSSATASAGVQAGPPTSVAPVRNDQADEFDGTGVDTGKWGIYASTSPNGSLWSHDAVSVSGGTLKITGKGRNPTGAGNVAGGVCWCGNGGSHLYGGWTVRARFGAGAGYGPQMMLWPDGDNAANGYANFAAFDQPDRQAMLSVVRWGTAGQKAEAKLAGDFRQWHTYRVEWRAGSLKIFVDDRVLFDSAAKAGTVVPSKPMHLVLQMVAGPKDGVPAANASTPDAVPMEIDWVRFTP